MYRSVKLIMQRVKPMCHILMFVVARNRLPNFSSFSRTRHDFPKNVQRSTRISFSFVSYTIPIFRATTKAATQCHICSRLLVMYRYLVTDCKVFECFVSFIRNFQIPRLSFQRFLFSRFQLWFLSNYIGVFTIGSKYFTNSNILFPWSTPLRFVPLTQLSTSNIPKNLR